MSASSPERLAEWVSASFEARSRALAKCLETIALKDPRVHAWVQISPQSATATGPLSGIPFGAKDIIDTRGLATEYGSAIYRGRVGVEDADIITELKSRGAILLGKTHTTAFAYMTPGPTRNPRNVEHTPGGSSSGSAAAVAAGMVPLALGTQTKGSVLRPASYCGVTGFKTTYGLLSMDGVLPFARSLDTLGFFTHTAADMLAFWGAIGQPVGRAEDVPLAVPDPAPDVEPDMAYAYRDAVARLLKARYTIRPIPITAMLTKLRDAQRTIMFYEGARFHEERFKEYGTRLGSMGDLVRDGLQISAQQFDDATRYVDECRKTMTALFKETPIVLVPAATGSAPRGLASTGDSRMNGPWTALGTPAVSIPIPMPSGLPLGLQLTGNHGDDARVLQTAARLERTLRTILTP